MSTTTTTTKTTTTTRAQSVGGVCVYVSACVARTQLHARSGTVISENISRNKKKLRHQISIQSLSLIRDDTVINIQKELGFTARTKKGTFH